MANSLGWRWVPTVVWNAVMAAVTVRLHPPIPSPLSRAITQPPSSIRGRLLCLQHPPSLGALRAYNRHCLVQDSCRCSMKRPAWPRTVWYFCVWCVYEILSSTNYMTSSCYTNLLMTMRQGFQRVTREPHSVRWWQVDVDSSMEVLQVLFCMI